MFRKRTHSPPSFFFFNSKKSLPDIILFHLNIPLKSLSAMHLCLEMPLSPHTVSKSVMEKDLSSMSFHAKVGETLDKANCYYPQGQPASEASYLRLWSQHSGQHTILSGKGVYESTRQALFSHCLCLGGPWLVLKVNWRQIFRLVGWSLSKSLLVGSQTLHCFPKFNDKLEENIQTSTVKNPKKPQSLQWVNNSGNLLWSCLTWHSMWQGFVSNCGKW